MLDVPMTRLAMDEFIISVPKVELHAHLNGCVREATLFDLAKERGITLNEHHFSHPGHVTDDHSMYNVRPRSLFDCFDMFAEISQCVDDLESLSRITHEALEDFAAQNVVYLELRSTPKKLKVQSGKPEMADKLAYCRTVLNCMKEFEKNQRLQFPGRVPMTCRFILAVDRNRSIEEATENINLAKQLKEESCNELVGVDLGGNPLAKTFDDFRPLFEDARSNGLKVTIHCAEVPCNDNDPSTATAYEEAEKILAFQPDRLGHALLLPPTLQARLAETKIPVESCPTSNVMTLELARHSSGSLLEGMKTHPQLENWLSNSHPIAIGTDDPGVFDTNASKELMLVQLTFGLSQKQIGDLLVHSMDHAFCDSETRTLVTSRIRDYLQKLLNP